MLPKIIHYIWLGQGTKPELVQRCIASWHHAMPDWEYREWNETTLAELGPITNTYYHQAYAARKFAFASDYLRLLVLERFGGVYLDTDVEVLRSLEELAEFQDLAATYTAFAGFEESLAHLPGTCVMACEPHCKWVCDMLSQYNDAIFQRTDGTLDLTTNVQRLGQLMVTHGLLPNGLEQTIAEWGLHIYPYDYFSPVTSTRVMRRTKRTLTIHHYAGSWTNDHPNRLRDLWLVRETINALILLKRRLIRTPKRLNA